tara:strand:- start:284 stop:385 length:102 start_codon:yes stop_codon:yes gene_type:complete
MAKGLDCGTAYYIAATEKSMKKLRVRLKPKKIN